VSYLSSQEVATAYSDALSFWAAAVAVIERVPGLSPVAKALEEMSAA
jgi:hypothetical protein